MTRFTTLALSLLAAAFLGACGLKGDLYLPAKQSATTPANPSPATSAAITTKAGDDSKATNVAPAAK